MLHFNFAPEYSFIVMSSVCVSSSSGTAEIGAEKGLYMTAALSVSKSGHYLSNSNTMADK